MTTASIPTIAEPARTGKGTILKYTADRGPVGYVLGMLAVHVALFWFATPWLALASVVPLAVAGMFVAPINHHHQHLNAFRSPVLNRFYDLALSLQTGVAPYAWVLHHNLGHHRNYLNQPPKDDPDESAWTRRDGTQMGRVEYTISLLLSHQVDIWRVARRFPKIRRRFLLMKLPLWSLALVGLWLDPVNYLLIFLVPGFFVLVHTIWATYEHHAGCEPHDHFHASVNRDNRHFNLLTGNLGLHTAHHYRPGVHWSLLPGIHAEIEHRIPEDQILKTFW
jgi:fatty acid desaturase